MADQETEENKKPKSEAPKASKRKAAKAAVSKAKASKKSTTAKEPKPPKATKLKKAAKAKKTKAPKTPAGAKIDVPAVEAPKAKRRLARLFTRRRFAVAYLVFAGAVLLASTAFWSVLGALIHQGNADQLSDDYLFENYKTFHGALFPDAHTFLLKWPIFVLMKFAGLTATNFAICTVALAVITVAAFAFLLSRIERRPLVLGTIFLALASVLLLIPAQPYPGGILPVNFAMITTRNIEYIVYLASLVLVVRAGRWRNLGLAGAAVLLGVLGASDKLFIDMSAGGAVLMLIVYGMWRKKQLAVLALRWLVVSILGFALAAGIVMALRASGWTNITDQSGAGPFGLVHDTKNLALGTVYSGLGLLTDFGANPAAHIAILRQIPGEAVKGLSNVGALTFVINLVLLLGVLFASLRLVFATLKRKTKDDETTALDGRAERLALMLLTTTVISFVMFIVSNHYYPVDSRYLLISLFALFVVVAVTTRHKKWPAKRVVLVGVILLASVGCGAVPAWHSYQAEKSAMATVNNRDQQIVQILKQHHVDTLVGDYWRVMPTRLYSGNTLQVMPMAGCTSPLGALSSKAWNANLKVHRFAYLLTFDHSLTGYPSCTLQQIISHYGRPDSSTLVAGTLNAPQEMLLFYDQGTMGTTRTVSQQTQSTVLPIGINQLLHRTCDTSTVMNIVAHQDDDLLFMNPDTLHAIQAGDCVRTIYVTAGDAGSNDYYWLSREKGAEAAYASMLGEENVWTQRIVRMPGGQYVTIANPRHNTKVSLIFMRLPDGNLSGQGFYATHYQSLTRLKLGAIKEIKTVDSQSTYTADQLITTLTTLMDAYGPAEIHTQSSMSSEMVRDHSDHRNVSYFATQAFEKLDQTKVAFSIKYYRGYPTRDMPADVSAEDLIAKQKAFLAYAQYDGSVCHSEEQCTDPSNNYTAYLRREYQVAQ